MKVLFAWPNKDQFGFKPMGIALLSSIVRAKGHEVELFDTTFIDLGFKDNTQVKAGLKIFKKVDFSKHDISKKKIDLERSFLDKLNAFEPDLICVSALSDEMPTGLKLSEIAKSWNRDVVVLWGNKSVTMSPRAVLENPAVDYACVGEGIEFISDFLDHMERKSDPKGIPNLVYMANGTIVKNPLRPFYQKLDSLPYLDWGIFDDRQFLKPYDGSVRRGGDYMIFWGCPNQCTYCINKPYRDLYGRNAGPYLRHYGIERAISEIEYLVKGWNIDFFKFHDEDFCLKPMAYFKEFAKLYRERLNIPFTIMANPRNINKQKAELLKSMNCVSVSMGIETGNALLRRDVLKRVETEEDIVRAYKLLNSYGIRTSAYNMIGIPFENRDTFMETVELNKKAEVRYPDVGFFFPLEGTELRDIAIKNGFFDESSGTIFRRDAPALKFNEISREELIKLMERFVLYIKMPKEFRKYIEMSERDDAVGKALYSELGRIYDECVFRYDGIWHDNGKTKEYLSRLDSISRQ